MKEASVQVKGLCVLDTKPLFEAMINLVSKAWDMFAGVNGFYIRNVILSYYSRHYSRRMYRVVWNPFVHMDLPLVDMSIWTRAVVFCLCIIDYVIMTVKSGEKTTTVRPRYFYSLTLVRSHQITKLCDVSLSSLGPSDTIWRQKTGSTLAQVMACCLTAPSHYLNQCWLIISKV